jgi:anti-anti-sigma regulatory factor
MERLIHDKVVFNMRELSFVGSSGITTFVETLRSFAQSNKNKPKFCGLGSEFKRVFAAGELAELEVYESANLAVNSFVTGQPGSTLILRTPEIPEFEEADSTIEDESEQIV